MKQFIEEKIAIVFVLMILFGLGAFFLAGYHHHTMTTMATIGSKQVFILIACCVTGSVFTILPVTYLYDIIKEKKATIRSLENRVARLHSPNTTPRRAQEAAHWEAAESPDNDDLDGDGEGDDSLRRLGVIR